MNSYMAAREVMLNMIRVHAASYHRFAQRKHLGTRPWVEHYVTDVHHSCSPCLEHLESGITL